MKIDWPSVCLVIGGFLLGAAIEPFSQEQSCATSSFYLEPQRAQPVPRMAPSQGTEKVSGKGLSRVLETSLIGGPWESQ